MRTFNSIAIASEQTQIPQTAIEICLSHPKAKTVEGFSFRRVKPAEPPKRKRRSNRFRKVLCYQSDGLLLDTYPNINVAAKTHGVSLRAVHRSCINRYRQSKSGLIFRFIDEPFDPKEKPYSTSRKIHMFDLEGNLLDTFNGVPNAERATGISRINIYNCLSKRHQFSRSGLLFRYEGEAI